MSDAMGIRCDVMTGHPERALSFGSAAGMYDTHRPTYPPAAVRWVLGTEPRTVIDLGAGTGILTRVLADLGHRVFAVEPDDAMRTLVSAPPQRVDVLRGAAEAIPLPNASADAVVAGQAYHWFDRQKAHPEVARVLRPGGIFAPLWNIRDESEPWVAELSRIADALAGRGGAHAHAGWMDEADLAPHFGVAERAVFRHVMPMDACSLLAMMQTRSYYLTAFPAAQRNFNAAVGRLLAGLPSTFDLPHLTVAYRARRAAHPS
jgi:SAM-dependent methyltransferase